MNIRQIQSNLEQFEQSISEEDTYYSEYRNLQPISRAYQGKFNTTSNIIVDIYNLDESMIDIYDIASALAKICRFGGNCNRFYSVAQHSLIVSALAPQELKKVALLHDASGAYLGDIIKPLKCILEPLYSPIEARFMQVIFSKFNLDINHLDLIKIYDMQALQIEHEYFQLNEKDNWNYMMDLLDLPNRTIEPAKIEKYFINKFNKLWS